MTTTTLTPPAAIAPLRFDNRYAALPESYYARVSPTPVPDPQLAAWNDDVATLLGLPPPDAAMTAVLAGNALLPGMDPIATVYAGHQFGNFVPQLGDGRALLLGEHATDSGARWEIQLKGAGRTPYSRFGDGRAVLRSTVREYLASEAMHGLGIPTTRALAIVVSPLEVYRETIESAAILTRVAPTHLRFGHFEYFYARGEHAALAPLADMVIELHFPEFAQREDRYAAWLGEVVERTARLMALWQGCGFVHGVMNTDNFSVLGLTLDYGPYGFMDAFDARRVFNHTDETGRYAWNQQPYIGQWNASRLLQACVPLLDATPERAVEIANSLLDRYPPAYSQAMLGLWGNKLGLRDVRDDDRELINDWLSLLHDCRADFSRSFRGLCDVRADDDAPPALREEIADLEKFDGWLARYRQRLQGQAEDDAARARRMNAVNPVYVLRNHLAQQAIARAEAGDFAEIETLRRLLRAPFDEQPGRDTYAATPPEHLRELPLSCSS